MKHLLRSLPIIALIAISFSGCAESNTTEYESRGRVVALTPETNTVTILHEDIPGYMESHEMAFVVAKAEELEGLMVGDLVSFEVEVGADGSVVVDELEKLPVDTQLTLDEPTPEVVEPDTTAMPDSTMLMEVDTTSAM